MYLIQGASKNVKYKVKRVSKFISGCNQINTNLQKHQLNQIKKDQKGYGTYSLNPFAFYPKNLKNTLISLMSNGEVSLLKDQMKKFEAAFIDTSYLEDPKTKTKNQDIVWREQEEQKRKKRFLAST